MYAIVFLLLFYYSQITWDILEFNTYNLLFTEKKNDCCHFYIILINIRGFPPCQL